MGSLYTAEDKFCSECRTFIPETLGDFISRPKKDGDGNDLVPEQLEYLCGYCKRMLDQIMLKFIEIQKLNEKEEGTDGPETDTKAGA